MDIRAIDGNLFIQSDNELPVATSPATQGYQMVENYNVPAAKKLLAAGYAVPHPIHDPEVFKYAGKFTPYKRQIDTAGFLSWHKRAWCLNDMGCVDKTTEFLTPNGWKRIDKFEKGDMIAEFDKDTQRTTFREPKGYVDLPNPDGTMYHFTGKNGMDQMVTPDHTMLLAPTDPKPVDGEGFDWDAAPKNKRMRGYRTKTAAELVEYITDPKRMPEDHWQWDGSMRHGKVLRTAAMQSPRLMEVDCEENANPENLRAAMQVLLHWEGNGRCLVPSHTLHHFIEDTSHAYEVEVLEDKKLECRLTPRVKRGVGTTRSIPLREVSVTPKAFEDKEFDELLTSIAQTSHIVAQNTLLELMFDLVWASKELAKAGGTKYTRSRGAPYIFTKHGREAITTLTGFFGGTATPWRQFKEGYRTLGRTLYCKHICTGKRRKPGGVVPAATCGYTYNGVKIAHGIKRKYCFQTTTGYWLAKRGGCVFLTGNTGKTASAIWATEFLRKTEGLRKTLIITTLSTMNVVWYDELFNLYPQMSCGVVSGDKKRKLMMLRQPYKYLVINHDGFKQQYILDEILKMDDLDHIILDEGSALRNHQTGRYKALAKIFRERPHLRFWALTGTPAPNAPTDVWALSRIINPDGTPPYFQRFKEQTMYKVNNFKWLEKPDAVDQVRNVMTPAIRVKVEDCDDIPKLMPPTKLQADMSKEQATVYETLKKNMMLEYRAQQEAHVVTAVNAAVLMSKLLQVCCGNLYDIDKKTIRLENKGRLKAAYDALIEVGASKKTKAIVFVPFKHSQASVLEYFTEQGLRSVLVNGDTKSSERARIFTEFQEDDSEDSVRVLIAHPRVAAHGITLTAASCILWYAPYPSLEYTQQANARIARTGQTQTHLRVIHLGSHAIEWAMYDKLNAKGENQADILKLYEDIIHDNLPS